MGIFRRRSNESIIAAPQPEVKPVVITATQLDPRSLVIQLGKISLAQLDNLEAAGITPDYLDLLNKLQNPAISQADFQDMYAWQAMFFIGTEAQLQAHFTNDSAITGNVTKLNTQGPRVPLFAAAWVAMLKP